MKILKARPIPEGILCTISGPIRFENLNIVRQILGPGWFNSITLKGIEYTFSVFINGTKVFINKEDGDLTFIDEIFPRHRIQLRILHKSKIYKLECLAYSDQIHPVDSTGSI
jgi:hypothetical protein